MSASRFGNEVTGDGFCSFAASDDPLAWIRRKSDGEFLWPSTRIRAITNWVSVSALTPEVTIATTENTASGRLSWQCLLEEAIIRPGTLHEAYARFWSYSIGNRILVLMQCRARAIEPESLSNFNRWKEGGRHVRKIRRAWELCIQWKSKAREWDAKRAQDSSTPTADGQELGRRTIFVFRKSWFVVSQKDSAPYEPEPIRCGPGGGGPGLQASGLQYAGLRSHRKGGGYTPHRLSVDSVPQNWSQTIFSAADPILRAVEEAHGEHATI